MPSFLRTLLVLAAAVAAVPTWAHHRQTPPVLTLTTSGDTPLSRQATIGRRALVLAVDGVGGKEIVTLEPFRLGYPPDPSKRTIIAGAGDHINPAISEFGRALAFESGSDPLALGLPGEQIVGLARGALFAATTDPSGSSENPAIDGTGRRIAFEAVAGSRHVFVRDQFGVVIQLSHGDGTSGNPVISTRRNLVAFESTSDPLTGAETGITQIWAGSLVTGLVDAVTAGLGPSTNPAASNDGQMVAFESTADLFDTQADTGVSQIFVYDTVSRAYGRLTDDPAGCHRPSIHRIQRDWRVAYVCDGVPYFSMLRANHRYEVSTVVGGNTQRMIAAMGAHFVLLSTTADLSDGAGTTPGHQVYLVNLYKRPPIPVPGTITWFPSAPF